MSDEPDFADPLAVLNGFITEMNQWERDAWRLAREARQTSDPASWQAPVAERKASIFTKYCSPKHLKYSDVGGFSKPPTYDPDAERVLDVVTERPGRVSIFTQRPGATSVARKCQYVLLKKNDRWWIDSKKEFDHQGKPYRVTL